MFIFDFFRWFGVITGYPMNWAFFTKKIYHKDKESFKRIVKGGVLIISNHFNPLDYVANVFLFFPRKLYVVASEDAFRNKLLTFGMKFWGGIKADRVSRSLHFITESVQEIKKGHIVQIFPEGHNTPDGTIKPFYPSYLMIALRANAPIIPVISDGNYGLFKRLHNIVGEPIYLDDYLQGKKCTREDLDRLNEIVFNKVLELRQELDTRIQQEKRNK